MDMLGGVLWVDELASTPTQEKQFTVSMPGRLNDMAQDLTKAAPAVAGA